MYDIQKLTEEIQTIADTIDMDMPIGSNSHETIKIAVEIQRNKILQEGLDNIYDILDDIKHNREH